MASIKDVAKLAGVGLGTVSRVINNKSSVRPETKEKVMWAIKELNYTPNEVARSFKLQATKLVGLMLPSVWHPFFSKLAYFIENELYNRGYKMLLCNSSTERDKEIQYLQLLKMNQVAGIITISYHDYYAHENVDLPLVSIDRFISDQIPHVTSDNYEGGRLAAEALIKGGAKHLAYLGGEPIYRSSVSDRKRAFIEVAQNYSIPYVIYETMESSNQEVVTATEFLKMYPYADGVFTSSDLYAAALVRQLERRGKKVPEDVQVIGFDGIQNNDYFKPILSTIQQPVEEMGRSSVGLLLNLIDKKEVPKETVLKVIYKKGETSYF